MHNNFIPENELLPNTNQRLLQNDFICENNVKCMLTNFESINNKMDEFKITVQNCKPDIIFGTETWLKEEVDDVLIHLPGFKLYRNDTTEVRGGVIIYVKDNLTVEECDILNEMNVKDTLWLKILCDNAPDLIVGVVYRKGDSQLEYNTNLLQQIVRAMEISNSKILLCGDFNLPNIDWVNSFVNDSDNSMSQLFFDKFNDLFLYQHVSEPTRQRGENVPHCLDLVLTQNEHNVNDVTIHSPLGKSDHSVITWNLLVNKQRICETEQFRYDYCKADYVKLRRIMNETDWNCVTNAENVNSAWEYFNEVLSSAVHKCVPRVKVSDGKKMNPPWFNARAKRIVRRKYFAWKRYTESRSYVRYTEYVKARNNAAKKLRKIRRDYEKCLIDKIKSNSKAFYMYINSKTKSKSSVTRLKNSEGVLTSNDLETADELNKFFQSVYVKEDDKELIFFNDFVHCVFDREAPDPFDFLGIQSVSMLDDIFFTPMDVKKLLVTINPNKAMGPDNIHPRVLKELSDCIYFPLYCIMRQSLDEGTLPDIWRVAHVTPIFKKGDRMSSSNYRPVSLTSQICKLLEKIIRQRLVDFLESNNIFCDEQHGFRKSRSCLTNLLCTLEEWTRLYDEGLPFDVLYLDFCKAFDSVPHGRLSYKLFKYGITGKLNAWLEDFLRGRKQAVCINGSMSSYLNVTSGVPQGSVLGPVLFLLFINDLPAVIRTKCNIFADDTKMYHPILSIVDHHSVQNDLESLISWSNEWLLGFNSNKCKVMHIGKRNPNYEYTMNGVLLQSVKEEKDLGVLVTSDLSFSKYISSAAAKANRILGIIKRSFLHMSKEAFLVLYKTYVRPHLEYCVQVWSPYLQRDKDVIEKVQRRATKIVPELRNLSYEERLVQLKLTTLENRRVRGDLIEVFKFVKGIENVSIDVFFQHRLYQGLRGHPYTLELNRCHYNMRKFFFSNRVVTLWNSLPLHVVSSPDVLNFKINYDRHYYNY